MELSTSERIKSRTERTWNKVKEMGMFLYFLVYKNSGSNLNLKFSGTTTDLAGRREELFDGKHAS